MLNRLESVLASLASHQVRYVVIGGIAASIHGVPHATFDLDILIDATEDNSARLLAALAEAGLDTAALISPAEVLANEITIFNDLIRIDVQIWTPGLDFAGAWARREDRTYRGQVLSLVCRQDLIAAKKAAGRPVDLADVRQLESTES